MKYEDIDENTVMISLTFQDLQERHIELTDFLMDQANVEEVFAGIVDELDLTERFSEMSMMTFQVQPNPKGVNSFVSDDSNIGFNMDDLPDSPEEMERALSVVARKSLERMRRALKSMEEQTAALPSFGLPDPAEKPQKPKEMKLPDKLAYVVRFEDFEDLLALAHGVISDFDDTELYEREGDYFLVVLENTKKKGREKTLAIRSRILEYGIESHYTREVLLEHGRLLLATKALESLATI